MAISGGIKLFDKSRCSFADGNVAISASTSPASAVRAIDKNRITYWRSSMSNDLTTETLTLDFTNPVTFSRLFLVDHNWKDFDVMYHNGTTYVHFASVVGIDGAKANITETVFADDTAYYEFTEVTTLSIRLRATKTQVANAQKYINQIVITEELGTLEGYPDITNVEWLRNAKTKKALSGKNVSLKGEESFKCGLAFKDYPSGLSDDIDLIFSLWDREDPFLLWLCGGRRGSAYFRKQLRGFRLRDIFQVQAGDKINPDYMKNTYTNPVSFTIALAEEAG